MRDISEGIRPGRAEKADGLEAAEWHSLRESAQGNDFYASGEEREKDEGGAKRLKRVISWNQALRTAS